MASAKLGEGASRRPSRRRGQRLKARQRKLSLDRAQAACLRAKTTVPAHGSAAVAITVAAQHQADREGIGQREPRQLRGCCQHERPVPGRKRAPKSAIWRAIGGHRDIIAAHRTFVRIVAAQVRSGGIRSASTPQARSSRPASSSTFAAYSRSASVLLSPQRAM